MYLFVFVRSYLRAFTCFNLLSNLYVEQRFSLGALCDTEGINRCIFFSVKTAAMCW